MQGILQDILVIGLLGDIEDKMPNKQGFDSMVVYKGWGHFEMRANPTPADLSIPNSVHSDD